MAMQTLTFMRTPRELDMLKLVAQGLSTPDIAERLVVSEHSAPAPGPHRAQAQPLLPRRSRGLGRAHRAGVSLARSGRLPRPGRLGASGWRVVDTAWRLGDGAP